MKSRPKPSTLLSSLPTQSTIPSSSTSTSSRRLFQRQSVRTLPNSLSRSNSHSRKPLSKTSLFPSLFSLSFIKLPVQSEFNTPLKLNAANLNILLRTPQKNCTGIYSVNTSSTLNKQKEKNREIEKELAEKVQELLEETIMRQQELNEIAVEKERIGLELQGEKIRIGILQQKYGRLMKDEYQMKNHIKHLTKQKYSLHKQNQQLLLKLTSLQSTLNRPINTPSNLKQQYLQSQLLSLRHQLSISRTSLQSLLQSSLHELRQQLFNANKQIENLNITNQCLQYKMGKIGEELRSTPELVGMREKYKRVCREKEEGKKREERMKREVERMGKEMEKLRGMVVGNWNGDQSLNFSMISNWE